MELPELKNRYDSFGEYKEYYSSNHITGSKDLETVLWYKNAIPRIAWITRFINVNKINSLLDVGCNTGCVSMTYALSGMRVVGIDLGKDAIDTCNFFCKNSGDTKAEYINTSFEEANMDEKFDCVVASEIIEHVLDPIKLLEFCENHSNKFVVITTPELNGVFGLTNTVNDTGHEHIRLYTRDELVDIINKRGKIVEELTNDIIHIAYEPNR